MTAFCNLSPTFKDWWIFLWWSRKKPVHVIKVWATLVTLIFLLLTILIVLKVRQLSGQGYLTFINLLWLSWRHLSEKQSLKNFITEAMAISAANNSNYKKYEQAFLALGKHGLYKIKKLRGNQVSYMTKYLRKAIMKRSDLKYKRI